MDYNVKKVMTEDGTPIEGLKFFDPIVFPDDRGYFFESYSEWGFMQNVDYIHFVQENQSCSTKGVFRGLHWQKGKDAQAKLVSVVKGGVYDIALDIRIGSPTFGKYAIIDLNEHNHRQFFIPRGFAHGFISYGDENIFQYKCDNYYNKNAECGCSLNSIILPNDINTDSLIVSPKDAARLSLENIPMEDLFVYGK